MPFIKFREVIGVMNKPVTTQDLYLMIAHIVGWQGNKGDDMTDIITSTGRVHTVAHSLEEVAEWIDRASLHV